MNSSPSLVTRLDYDSTDAPHNPKAEDCEEESKETLVSLAGEILVEARKLIRQEVDLALDELAHNWTKVKIAVLYLLLSVLVTVAAGVLLAFTLAHFLAAQTTLPVWGCEAIACGSLILIGVFLIKAARLQINSMSLVPKNTLANLKENLVCLKNKI